MKYFAKLTTAAILLGTVASVLAQVGLELHPIRNQINIICSRGDQVRTIDILLHPAGTSLVCEVMYARDNQVKTLWSAKWDPKYCEEKALGFVKKQHELGYSCVTVAKDSAQ